MMRQSMDIESRSTVAQIEKELHNVLCVSALCDVNCIGTRSIRRPRRSLAALFSMSSFQQDSMFSRAI